MNSQHTINEVSIIMTLDKLAIQYHKQGNVLHLKSGGKQTNGRKANINQNYVNDFSGKRATGPPYSFVKQYLGLSSKDTFKRFEDHFGIKSETTYQKKYTKRKRWVPTRIYHPHTH